MSRKIEDQMIAAIRTGAAWKNGNTEVRQFGDHAEVRLHGNTIARIGHPQAGTVWTLAGWNTPTTRSRINALARAFNWRGVFCRHHVPFASGSATAPMMLIAATEWVDALA